MKRSGKTSSFLWSFLILSTILYFTGCNGGSSSDSEAPVPETTSKIGSKGGTVIDEGGASVVIPPGALSKETEITVVTYRDTASMPEEMYSTLFGEHGAAEFLPDGIQFSVPATITIPSPILLTPGQQILLFQWNETESAWEQTEFIATVNPDGLSYSAEVTHFTTLSGNGGTPPNGLNNLDDPYMPTPDPTWIEATFYSLTKRFEKEYERSLSSVQRNGNCIMEVTGLHYTLHFQQGTFTYQSEQTEGEVDGSDFIEVMIFQYHDTRPVSSGIYKITARIFWTDLDVNLKIEATPTEVLLSPPGTVNSNDSSHIEVTVEFTESDGYNSTFEDDIRVDFSLQGPGSLNPETALTKGIGAETYFYPSEPGTVLITATVTNCEGTGHSKKASATVEVEVKESKWEAWALITFKETGNVPWRFEDTITMTVPFAFDDEGNIISGDGQGTHSKTTIEALHPENSIRNVQAPDFNLSASGSVNGQTLHLQIAPEEPLSLWFDIYGGDQYQVFISTQGFYGVNEWAIILETMNFDLPLDKNHGYAKGSGVKEFGDSQLSYECELYLLWSAFDS